MGVKGLWDIVSPSGIRVKPESLEGQTLAIDASIWLKQFLIGIKDGEGNIPRGVHLLGFFKRICKLLYYGILPVVVFDGVPPDIKKRTLEQRRMQREMSEINVRRAANRLLLNSIRLRVAKKIRSKVRNFEDGVESGGVEGEKSLKNEGNRINLFSSESESDDNYIEEGSNEQNMNSSTSLFPVMGFLSERRRLDEMPEIDTNLFKMPISSDSRNKGKIRKLTNVNDFSVYMRKNSDAVDERRLIDLPLDTEIDPQVFEQLNSKLQYEILIQLRDAWLSSLRMNAVNTKDNMSQFSNSQMECYLRYLRINQEIEKLKLRMAKECEEGQIDYKSVDNKVIADSTGFNEGKTDGFIEFGRVCDPDELVNDFSEIGESAVTSIDCETESKGNSTLMDRIYNYSANKLSEGDNGIEVLTRKDNSCVVPHKLSKKERTEYLKSTNYSSKDISHSNPLNTPLFKLEGLLQIGIPDTEGKNRTGVSSSSINDCFNDSERVELLKENVNELFGFCDNNKDKLSTSIYSLDKNSSNMGKGETDSEWEDVEWVNMEESDKNSDSFEISRNRAFYSDLMLNLNSELDIILNSESTKIENLKTELIKKRPKIDLEQEPDCEIRGGKPDMPHVETESSKELKMGEHEKEETLRGITDDKCLGKGYLTPEEHTIETGKEEEEERQDEEHEDKDEDESVVEQEKSKYETTGEKGLGGGRNSKSDDQDVIEGIKETIETENMLFNEFSVNDHDMDELLLELEKEQEELNVQYKKQSVILNSEITKEMKYQVCMLLEAFGIPWIESPGEAEAQASLLTELNICNGVLSDDSDCLLFGAKKVYRNFFSGTCAEMYDIDKVKRFLGINKQDQMYILALLLGCDYTVGVSGIGPVNALEILKAYPELEDMVLLKNWSFNKLEDKNAELLGETAERAEFKRSHMNYRHSWVFPSDFPCLGAINAMRNPNVNRNFKPKFGNIKKDLVVQIMTGNTDLNAEKVSTIIDSVIKNQEKSRSQTKIHNFLLKDDDKEQTTYREDKVSSIVSKRMKKALFKRQGGA
ncbi:RAD2 [Cryptosporidium ryanae]|uniref:RAD2 n=1 Tax=Cryptosporidium ryanae TaxID=515981 RepID=UPI00351A7534|nr:RAD2 [Cryptosporidium ryanae]